MIKEASPIDADGKKIKISLYANYLKLHHSKKAWAAGKDKRLTTYIPLSLLWLRFGADDITLKVHSLSSVALIVQGSKKVYTSVTLQGPEFSVNVLSSEKQTSLWQDCQKEISKSKQVAGILLCVVSLFSSNLEGDGYFTNSQRDKTLKRSQGKVPSVLDLASARKEDVRVGKYTFEDGGAYEGDWVNGRVCFPINAGFSLRIV